MNPEVLCIRNRQGEMQVDWPRQPAELLFVGQEPEAVLLMVPRLFSLCTGAQTLAARLALQQARGDLAVLAAGERQALALEAVRETLRKVLLDWSLVFDAKPADSQWLARWRHARTLEACAALAREAVFGQESTGWLALGEAGWLDWIEQRHSAPARWLAGLARAQQGCVFLPQIDATCFVREYGPRLWEDGPLWQGQPCEVGALAREQQSLPLLLRRQHLAQARLLARLLQLARWLDGDDWPAASVACITGGALALVETARGPLLHVLELDDHQRVVRYRVIPPTLWHTQPHGLIQRVLMSLPVVTAQAMNQQVSLIDPCVAFEIDQE
jgi:hypothetical protein